MNSMKIHLLIIVFGGVIFISCSNEIDPWPEKAMDSELYKRDSTYVAIAHKQRLKPDSVNNIPGIKTKELFVDVLLYGPDTLKLFAATIEEKIFLSEEYEELEEDVLRYTGRGLAGYRENISQPWKLYYLPMMSTTTNSYEETSLSLRAYFLDQVKKHELSVMLEDGTTATIPMRYSVDDPHFWEGPVWTKGNRIPGRYMFEATQSGTRNKPPFIETSPFDAEYPEWLLEQF